MSDNVFGSQGAHMCRYGWGMAFDVAGQGRRALRWGRVYPGSRR
jgi:hypothetical protein